MAGRTFWIAAAAAAGAVLWSRRDYRAWTALGPGGLPHTAGGWLEMTRLRLQKHADPADPHALDPVLGSDADCPYLGALLRRSGPRPRVAPHPIPQRQLDQHAGTAMRQRLEAAFEDAVRSGADLLHFKKSFFEKHCPAVTLKDPRCGHAFALASQGEIAHIHASDGSMHMILSPSDAAAAMRAGWGERHALAGSLGLPATYLFVYPPRDEVELEVVRALLDAAIGHMSQGARSQDKP